MDSLSIAVPQDPRASLGREFASQRGWDSLEIAAFGFIFVVGFVGSLVIHLFAVAMQAEAVSGAVIGFSTAAQAAGIIAGSFASARLATRFGLAATLQAACVVASLALLSLAFLPGPLAQILPRIVFACGMGAAAALINVIITSRARPAKVGRSVAAFSLSFALGSVFAPSAVLVLGTDVTLNVLFCAGILLVAGAFLDARPIHLVIAKPERSRASVLETFRITPYLFLPAFVFGALDNGFLSLLGPWSLAQGADLALASAVTSAGLLGVALLQMPLAALAERLSARLLIAAFGAVAIVLLAGLGGQISTPWLVLASVFVLGVACEGFYTIGLVELATRLPAERLVAGNSCFVALCGVGELTGPSLSGIGLHMGGAWGMSLATAGLVAASALLMAGRAGSSFASSYTPPSRRRVT